MPVITTGIILKAAKQTRGEGRKEGTKRGEDARAGILCGLEVEGEVAVSHFLLDICEPEGVRD
jgi:hypothetical protein